MLPLSHYGLKPEDDCKNDRLWLFTVYPENPWNWYGEHHVNPAIHMVVGSLERNTIAIMPNFFPLHKRAIQPTRRAMLRQELCVDHYHVSILHYYLRGNRGMTVLQISGLSTIDMIRKTLLHLAVISANF